MVSAVADMSGLSSVAAEAMPANVVLALAREAAFLLIVCSLSVAIWRGYLRPLRDLYQGAGEKPRSSAKRAPAQPAAQRRSLVTASCATAADAATTAGAARDNRLSAEESAKAAETRIIWHLEKHQFTVALNAFRTYEREGLDRFFSEEVFSQLIQSSIRVSKLDVTLDMLRKIKRAGLKPSLGFWQTTFRLLASRKLFGGCLAVHSLFGDELPLDRVVFTCLVNAAIEKESFGIASQLLDQKSGLMDLEPNDYVIFFRTYVAMGDSQKAEQLFRSLGERGDGAFVTTLMLNLTLLTCVQGKQAARAMDIISKAHEFEQVYSKKIVDVVSYNTLLKGCAAGVTGSRSACCDCLRSMFQNGVAFDEISCRLLDASIDGNDADLAGEICDVFLSQTTTRLSTPMYTSLVKCLIRCNRSAKAMEVYKEMRQGKTARPNMSTYSVLVKGFVEQRNVERALEIVADMRVEGKSMDDIMLMHVLDGCRAKCKVEVGMDIFKETAASGVKVSVFTLSSLLKLLGRGLKVLEAIEVLEGWEAQHGWKPSVVHYTCAISACIRTGQADLAWKAYTLMLSNGVSPDETAVKTLARCLQEARRWDRVLQLSKQASQLPTPVKIPADILNVALAQLSGTH